MRKVTIVTIEVAVATADKDEALGMAAKAMGAGIRQGLLVDYRLKGLDYTQPLPIVDVPDAGEYQEFDAWLGRDYDI